MKIDETNLFKNAIEVDIVSFKEEKTFKLTPLTDKPKDKALIPFVSSFKRKHNVLGELIKHKTYLCINDTKQAFSVDY